MFGYHELEGPGGEGRPSKEKWEVARLPKLDLATGGQLWHPSAAVVGQSIDIVVAMHTAPVATMIRALLLALPLGDSRSVTACRIFIYKKGPTLSPSERVAIEAAVKEAAAAAELRIVDGLRNTGRCDHSYLTHVVNHRDDVADVTLFLKDTAMAHVHIGAGARLLAFARRLPDRGLHFWCARTISHAPCWFVQDRYASEQCRDPLDAL